MPDIFYYTDYRKFLADYYAERKAENAGFSYKAFSDKAGFPNKGFLHNVISGNKNLSKSSAVQLSQAMKLNAREAGYFEDLVFFNQARNFRERTLFFERLSAHRSNRTGAAEVRQTRKEQYEFYSQWYISAIRSLIDMHPLKDDYQTLAKNVFPPISKAQAHKAVDLMAKLGMIKRRKDGLWAVTDKTITAGKEIIDIGLQHFQLQVLELAINAQRELPKDKRHISGLTLGISRKTYDWMCREIEAFQERLMAVAEKDNEADNVYQLNFQFFPMSNMNGIATPRRKTKS